MSLVPKSISPIPQVDSPDFRLWIERIVREHDPNLTSGADPGHTHTFGVAPNLHASDHESGGGDEISHDSLAGFVSNEHIDHSGLSITASGLLSGGGILTSSRTITLANSDIDHDQLTNTGGDKHIDWTNASDDFKTSGSSYLYGDIYTDRWLEHASNTFVGVNVVGNDALAHSAGVEGYFNSAFGHYAAYSNTTGYYNSIFGSQAAYYNTTGYCNSIFGNASAYSNTTGYLNSAFGYASAYSNQEGDYNLVLGSSALFNNEGSLNVAIGYYAGYNQTTASNLLIIDNQNRGSAANELAKSLIYGTFDADPANQTLRFNAATTVNGSLAAGATTATSLTLDMTQDWLFTNRGSTLAIQGQTAATDSVIGFYSKTGEGAENTYLQIFGVGIPTDIDPYELMNIGYIAANTDFEIFTASTSGTDRQIRIYAAANTSQFVLGTDGNISMGGDLVITGSLTTADLTLNFSGQNYLFTSRANAILAVQGQASGQAAGFEFYTGDGDGTDDISIDLYAMGSPSDLTDMERLKVGFDQSESYWQIYSGESGDNTIYPIHLWTEGHASQLVLGNDGHNSMSGNLAVTGTVSGATASTFGNLTLANGSITDSGGAISFDDEDLSTSGDISAAKFAGSGDADTYMAMSNDVFSMVAGGVTFATLQELFIGQDVFVVNTNQADVDFKVNASGAENLLLCDAENARVGINDGSPAEALDVTGNVNVTGVYKVDDVQVVSSQQAHIADASTQDLAGTDTIDEENLESDLAGIVSTINSILSALETHGLLADA